MAFAFAAGLAVGAIWGVGATLVFAIFVADRWIDNGE